MRSDEQVAAAAAARGLDVELRAFPQGTRTAEDARPLRCFVDDALLAHDVVWAAAGTPTHVFASEPRALATAADAQIVTVRTTR